MRRCFQEVIERSITPFQYGAESMYTHCSRVNCQIELRTVALPCKREVLNFD